MSNHNHPQMATTPEHRMGVYKCLEDVPNHYRLKNYEAEYTEKDPWDAYLDDYITPPRDSERKQEQADRSFKKWSGHMEAREAHYALASPDDVEAWAYSLTGEYSIGYASTNWEQIERFYSWLMWHSDYPHRYHPFLMAAAREGAASDIWWEKISRSIEVDSQ